MDPFSSFTAIADEEEAKCENPFDMTLLQNITNFDMQPLENVASLDMLPMQGVTSFLPGWGSSTNTPTRKRPRVAEEAENFPVVEETKDLYFQPKKRKVAEVSRSAEGLALPISPDLWLPDGTRAPSSAILHQPDGSYYIRFTVPVSDHNGFSQFAEQSRELSDGQFETALSVMRGSLPVLRLLQLSMSEMDQFRLLVRALGLPLSFDEFLTHKAPRKMTAMESWLYSCSFNPKVINECLVEGEDTVYALHPGRSFPDTGQLRHRARSIAISYFFAYSSLPALSPAHPFSYVLARQSLIHNDLAARIVHVALEVYTGCKVVL